MVCIWGFFTYLFIYIAFYILIFLETREDGREWRDIKDTLLLIATMILGPSYMSHFITLMVMRWRHAGKVCSGDYLDIPNRYSLFDAKEPYLHDAGSFLYYAINS